jgi:hypothetical protein
MTCFPWFSPTYRALATEAWTKAIIPSGCSIDAQGNVPCAPESMRAAAEAWLTKNAPQALTMIGGKLALDTYTFARYMHSEVGSGTIEERIAVGEAGMNQAKKRAGLVGNWLSKLRVMLTPNDGVRSHGYYGAIHSPAAYCQQAFGKSSCNGQNRWAATSRDPSVLSLLLAHLVVSGASGDIASGATTQWGPDAFKFTDGSKIDSPAQAERFVRVVANQGLYWVGPIAGVDPFHTFLVKEGPKASTTVGQGLIALGIGALPMSGSKMLRPDWSAGAVCKKPVSAIIEPVLSRVSPNAQTFFVSMLGLAAGASLAYVASKRLLDQ